MASTNISIGTDPVKQFSVFAENRVGRLYDLTALLKDNNVHVMALTVLDTVNGIQTLARIKVDASAPCPADLNHDHVVNGADLGTLLGNWNGSGEGDLNNDGTVNGADLGTLLGAWGPCP